MSFEETFLTETKNLPCKEKYTKLRVLELADDIEKLTLPCIEGFISWIKGVLKLCKLLKNEKGSLSGEKINFKEALIEIHAESICKLGTVCMKCNRAEVREASLTGLMNLLPLQAKSLSSKNCTFPIENFTDILYFIINSESAANPLINGLEGFLLYRDMATYFWKCLELALFKTNLNSRHIHNALLLIGLTPKPGPPKDKNEEETAYFCGFAGVALSEKLIAASVLKIWEILVSVEANSNTKQQLILTIIERLMGRMEKPIFLTDYFMSCLNCGGASSVLGLQGIFTLIQKHNINYPDIYTKLYSLFSVDLFSTPYKSRLYYLSDVFLKSTHLPEALIAGYIKRFARLCLVAPPPDIVIMMKFIINLLLRHPGLRKLMHSSTAGDVSSDPYDFEELDPSLSRGSESSLWELRLLQSHVLPSVANLAAFVSTALPSAEQDIAQNLDDTTADIFTRECKKKLKEVPLCFEKPTSLFLPNIESGFVLWSFSD